jgi:hypothetical protein
VTEGPRNPNLERQYETRLDRAISDTQTKIQTQRRALDDVLRLETELTQLREKLQDEDEKQSASTRDLSPEAKVVIRGFH